MQKKYNPYNIIKMFEGAMCDYTGAKYAIATDTCTNSLYLCLEWFKYKQEIVKNSKDFRIKIPSKTYLSVPQAIMRADYDLMFDAGRNYWKGIYQLDPLPIYDSARRLTSDMYIPGSFMCLSFHIKKHLKIGKGGMILCDNKEAYEWFKKMRYEGRSEVSYHVDDICMNGFNHYMTPVDAARGLMLMQNYPEHMEDLPELPPYRDLKEFSLFKEVPCLVDHRQFVNFL